LANLFHSLEPSAAETETFAWKTGAADEAELAKAAALPSFMLYQPFGMAAE
jgi:hypothetical protein